MCSNTEPRIRSGVGCPGYGYMREYPIARLSQEARVQKAYGGANEIMKTSLARCEHRISFVARHTMRSGWADPEQMICMSYKEAI